MIHHHQGSADTHDRAFTIGIALNVAYVIGEGLFGVFSGSLALLADAGHNLSDVVGLLLAWGASTLSRRKPSQRRTYGWHSSSILAAMLNAVILLLAVGAIAWEAVKRLAHPAPVAGKTVIVVAAMGVIVNSVSALQFMSGRKSDLNLRGAFLHMAADAAVSAGVVVAGVAMLLSGWLWLDPVLSLLIAVVILTGTWGLLRESLDLALDAVPYGINPGAVESYLRNLCGVSAVHDLHIWAMSTSETALTAHLVKAAADDDDALIAQASRELHERFKIAHSTLQWERSAAQCPNGPACEDSGEEQMAK
ncbi:MAG: cation diffusion facilitator family transporter [Candidatus Aminicenantes bacterium]|nr:cation diffusion facilitator family transporter [Candidatus Aminicenantes bacterium]